MDAILDFIRDRQLNLVMAALLILGYLFYQFGGKFLSEDGDLQNMYHGNMSKSRLRSTSRSRQRSRSRSREQRASSRRRRVHRREEDDSSYE